MKDRKITRILFVLAILIGLLAVFAVPPASAAETIKDCKKWHTVQHGEYLTQIAKLYDTTWRVIADINGISSPYVIYPGQKLCVSTTTGSGPTTPPVVPSGTKIYAISVREDKTVTLQGKDLAPQTRHTVYLSNEKTTGAPRILVGYALTDKGGAFKATFNIPKKLYDVSRIRVTIVSAKGTTATNWFFNADLDWNTGGVGSPALSVSIESVKADKWVKIKVSNLPADVVFKVYLGKAGTKGVKGILVGTIVAPKGGAATATFDIPVELQDRSKLDILVENQPFVMSVYKTFENKNK